MTAQHTTLDKPVLQCKGVLLGLLLSLAFLPAWGDGLVTNSAGGSENAPGEADGGSNPEGDEEPSASPPDADPDPEQAEEDKTEKPPADDGFPCPPNADDSGTGGDPVSLHDGRLQHSETDLVVNGLFPIRIRRSYDSRSTYDSPLGFGWALYHDRRLFQYPDSSVVIRYGCGSRDRFVYTGGAYVTPAGAREGDLVENPDGSFVYTRQYGTREFYDAQGRLTAVQNRYGHRHEYSYDPAGKLPLTGTSPFSIDPTAPMTVAYTWRLTRIDERAADGVLTGNYVTFAYNATTGRLTTVISGDGRSVSYVHDTTAGLTQGNLVQVNGLEGIVTAYQYMDANDVHNLTSVQEQAGATPWITSYDTQDRVAQQTHGNDLFLFNYVADLAETQLTHTIRDASGLNPYNSVKTWYFDANGNVSRVRDTEGNEIAFLRDPRGNMTRKTFYENQGTVAVPDLLLVRTINFAYDAQGRKTSESVTLDSGETVTRSWTWDNGWLASSQVASSAAPAKLFRTEYTFYRDGQGVPTNIQETRRRKDDGSFQTTSYVYDAKNRVSSTTLPDGQKVVSLYEGGSLYLTKRYYEVGAAESPYGQVRFGYDARGNRDRVWDGNNNLTLYAHDDLGRLVSVTNAIGEQTLYTYTLRRLTQVETGYTTAEGEGQVSRFNYSAEGWRTSVDEKDDAGAWQRTLTNTFDSAGKLLTATDAQNRSFSYQYDALGRRSTLVDPSGKSTSYTYDMFNNPVSITDASGNETRAVYDDLDRVIQVTQPGVVPAVSNAFGYDASGNLVAITDGEGNTTTYSYDSLSRRVSVTQALGQTTQDIYDDRGRIDYSVNARGGKVDYDYAPWGVVSSVAYFASETAPTPYRTISYSHDHALNLLTESDDSIQAGPLYAYTYDALNRVDVATVSYIPGGSRTLDYGYDRYGNRDSLVFTDGAALTHSYVYDRRNRLVSAELPNTQNFAFSYYPNGTLQQATYPNGVTADYVYSSSGPVQNIAVAGSSGTIEQFAYTFDNVLNVDTMTDNDGQRDYDYDGLYRLTRAVYPAATGLPTENFGYDGAGNREDPSDGGLYHYDANNRIAQSPGLTYGFDDDGNLVGRSDGANLTYNNDNRLVQFTRLATSATYGYDPAGRRIHKSVDGVTTWFLWDGSDLLAEFDGSGARTKRYAYLPSEFQPAQMEDGNGTYNVHADHSRTPRLLTNGAQETVWRSFHKAFGEASVDDNPDGDSNAIALNQRFPGQYFDGESGLHYNYSRYYDAATGRYLRADGIGQAGDLNAYLYASANPVNYGDPNGEIPIWLLLKGAHEILCAFLPTKLGQLEREYKEQVEKLYEDQSKNLKDAYDHDYYSCAYIQDPCERSKCIERATEEHSARDSEIWRDYVHRRDHNPYTNFRQSAELGCIPSGYKSFKSLMKKLRKSGIPGAGV